MSKQATHTRVAEKILKRAQNTVGGADFCASAKYSVYLFSEDNVEFGSNNILQGVQIGAGKELKLGSDITSWTGVYGEANGKIDYGSSENMGACENDLESDFGEIEITVGFDELALVQ